MIPFEIFKSIEIYVYLHRFLFESAKYTDKQSTSLRVHMLYTTINTYASCISVNSSTGMPTITDDKLPPIVDIVPANTQKDVICASSVASVGQQEDRANRAK